MQAIEQRYRDTCSKFSDVKPHLPRLHALAKMCGHVTEFGVRGGNTTTAFLYAAPKTLVCVDIDCGCQRVVDEIASLCPDTATSFVCEDTLRVSIDPTNLLFVDTTHTYEHLTAELSRHSSKVSDWIAMHDTGIDDMWRAVQEFVAKGDFVLAEHYTDSYGLTVLKRMSPCS